MNRFLKVANEERSVGQRVNDVIDKRVREMEKKNRFLTKQAGNLEEELQEQNYLAKGQAYDRALEDSLQYPDAVKQRMLGVGAMGAGGAALGALGAHKLTGGHGKRFGAVAGGIGGIAGFANVVNPRIDRSLNEKHPGREEANRKVSDAWHDWQEAEY